MNRGTGTGSLGRFSSLEKSRTRTIFFKLVWDEDETRMMLASRDGQFEGRTRTDKNCRP